MKQEVLTIVTASSTEPVSLSELKDFLKIDSTDEDDLLDGLISSVRQQAESYQGRSYLQQTLKYTLDRWPLDKNYMELPRATPLSSSGFEVVYYDEDNVATTWSSTCYILDTYSEPGRLVLETDEDWPDEDLYPTNAIQITYKAGSTGIDKWNESNKFTKYWIMNAVSYLYQNRLKDLSDFPFGALNAKRVRGVV